MLKNLLIRPGMVALFFMLIISSCEKDKGPMIVKPASQPAPDDPFKIHYQQDIQPLFDENCIICHNLYHPYLDLRAEVSWNNLWHANPHGIHAPYVDTINPNNSNLIRHLKGNGYPLMPLNAPAFKPGRIDTIVTWMLEGARNN
ncbi:MAG: hypothetical protein NT126_01715 [Bacteroidetes bacterium]|nr:hypothetical protein [Bacteroidota bacterium]